MILDHFPDQKTFIELAETANVIPVCTQILADMETPVSILQKFYKKIEQFINEYDHSSYFLHLYHQKWVILILIHCVSKKL